MNAALPSAPPLEPFFMDTSRGTRFCIYHAPRGLARGAVLYLHPFAEEMNKSRRMAALQSRAFAQNGFAVLQMDLFGCGDSCGDFSAARWEFWKEDVESGLVWLAERQPGAPIYLWGLRLGGLLALDVACTHSVDGIILWQPVISGKQCVNQFLRTRLARGLMDGGDMASTAGLRAQLIGHGSIEIAGYELAAALVHALDRCEASQMRPRTRLVEWIATSTPAEGSAAAIAARMQAAWRDSEVRFRHVAGPPFWATTEITESHALLGVTLDSFGSLQR